MAAVDIYNKGVSDWTRLTREKLYRRILALGLQDRLKFYHELRLRDKRNLKSKLKKSNGQVDKITFTFPYQGWFVETGTRKGISKQSSKAVPRPWLSLVINDEIKKLADLAAEHMGDEFFESIKVSN